MALDIIDAGFLSLVQDYGRYGCQHVGVTRGGPMDEHAFLWANYLLGNDFNAPQLEISMGGFSAHFKKNTTIALCGADLNATLNNQPVTPWQTYSVKAGDSLQLQNPVKGLRSYLAIKGGFIVEQQLASCATVMREQLGGLNKNGNKLNSGDTIDYPISKTEPKRNRKVPPSFIPDFQQQITLRFIPNHSITSAGKKALENFTAKPYELTQQMDRMGYRLAGSVITPEINGIISQGVAVGSIQIPSDGQPIVLMRDCQTMGGYPLIGCIAYLDLPLLAQCLPGAKISFVPVEVSDLESELILYKQFFKLSF